MSAFPHRLLTARERQQAVLAGAAKSYPHLAHIFTVTQKDSFSIMSRPTFGNLPPQLARRQNQQVVAANPPPPPPAAPLVPIVSPMAAQQQLQAITNQYHANLNGLPGGLLLTSTAAPINTTATTTAASQVPLNVIQPHAALTPAQIVQHARLRQLGLMPPRTADEISQSLFYDDAQKKIDETRANLRPKDLLRGIKGGKIEKKKTRALLGRMGQKKEDLKGLGVKSKAEPL